jgi:hypothetical protein
MRFSKIFPFSQEVKGRKRSSRSFRGDIVAFALLISSPLMGEDEGGGDTASRVFPSLPPCGIPHSLIYAKRCGTSSPPTRGGENLPFTHTKGLRDTKEFF